MAFRDDREALKQRAADLEAELASAERELDQERANAQRAKQLEAELVRARERLHAFERQMPGRRSPSRMVFVLAGVAVALLMAGGVMALVLARPAPPPAPVPALTTVEASPPVVAVPPQPQPTQATPEAAREVTAVWRGRVKSVSGTTKITPGAACEIEAVLRRPQKSDVRVSCGGETIYRSTDPLSGISQSSLGIGETPGPSRDTTVFWLTWDDVGTRTGARTEASIHTDERIASVKKETAPSFSVEIEVDVLSEPAKGALEPSHTEAALSFTERTRAKGKVGSVKGRAPITRGASCELTLAPAWGSAGYCRASLRCGGKLLYGDGTDGYATCELAEGKATAFRDEIADGDPRFVWDLTKGSAEIVVSSAEGEWSAEIAGVTAVP